MVLLKVKRYAQVLFGLTLMVGMLAGCDGGAGGSGGPPPTALARTGASEAPTTTPSIMSVLQTPFVTVTPISGVARQTIEGISVEVEPIAFDAHRVVVAYRWEGPDQPYPYGLELSWYYDASPGPALSVDGKELPWIREASTGSYLGTKPFTAGQPVRVQGTLAFDASVLAEDVTKRNVSMRLTFSMRVDTEMLVMPEPVPTGVALPTATATPTPAHAPSRTLKFDLSFNAALAFDQRRVVVPVHQTVEGNDAKVTLEEVDITASETRMLVRYAMDKEGALPQQWDEISASLRVGVGNEDGMWLVGKPAGPDEGACSWYPDEGECLFIYSGPSLLREAAMDYTLEVTANMSGAHNPLGGYTPAGRWVFMFTVPAGSTDTGR